MKDYSAFYTVEPVYRTVTKEEFDTFLRNYPRRLERDICGIGEPPLASYNDFELANRWPHSIVAQYSIEDAPEFEILINYEECFSSKTGYVAPDTE